MQDLIHHPDHYTQGIECWDYITSHDMGYLEGNIIKYVTRYKDKDGLKDLKKAAAYLNKLIEQETPEIELLPWAPPGTMMELPPSPGTMMKWRSGEGLLVTDPGAVMRLNGAIPLPRPAPELWHGFPLGPVLDGRNCTPFCTCPGGHQEPEKPQAARPAITGDDTDEEDFLAFFREPWLYE